MKLKFILAALLAAGAAGAQTEQWLEYHTSNDGRSYHQLQLSTNPPPGVSLPKLNSPAYFAFWKTPLDPAGGRWVCFDRTRKSGPCDRLFIDRNGNGLADEQPISARVDSYNSYFPATPLVFKGEDGPVTYHLILRFYQYDKSPAYALAASGGWYEGMVNFGGTKKRVHLLDGNVNGTFNDTAENAYDSDRVQIDGDQVGERFLGKLLEVDGKFFNVEAARDGAFIKVKPAENVVLGPVHVPENISEFTAFGANGHFVRKPVNGEFTLPEGKYQIFRWTINRKDDKGAPWTLSGYSFPKDATFNIAATTSATLDIGEPVKAVLNANEQPNRYLRFNLEFVGKQKESIELLRDSQRPRGPKLMLANAKGELCYTNTFEFG